MMMMMMLNRTAHPKKTQLVHHLHKYRSVHHLWILLGSSSILVSDH